MRHQGYQRKPEEDSRYHNGWNDAMEGLRDCLARGGDTADYCARIDREADRVLSQTGMATSVHGRYSKGAKAAIAEFRTTGKVRRLGEVT